MTKFFLFLRFELMPMASIQLVVDDEQKRGECGQNEIPTQTNYIHSERVKNR